MILQHRNTGLVVYQTGMSPEADKFQETIEILRAGVIKFQRETSWIEWKSSLHLDNEVQNFLNGVTPFGLTIRQFIAAISGDKYVKFNTSEIMTAKALGRAYFTTYCLEGIRLSRILFKTILVRLEDIPSELIDDGEHECIRRLEASIHWKLHFLRKQEGFLEVVLY